MNDSNGITSKSEENGNLDNDVYMLLTLLDCKSCVGIMIDHPSSHVCSHPLKIPPGFLLLDCSGTFRNTSYASISRDDTGRKRGAILGMQTKLKDVIKSKQVFKHSHEKLARVCVMAWRGGLDVVLHTAPSGRFNVHGVTGDHDA